MLCGAWEGDGLLLGPCCLLASPGPAGWYANRATGRQAASPGPTTKRQSRWPIPSASRSRQRVDKWPLSRGKLGPMVLPGKYQIACVYSGQSANRGASLVALLLLLLLLSHFSRVRFCATP